MKANTIKHFNTQAAEVYDADYDLTIYAFGLPGGVMLLSVVGEVSILLTSEETGNPREASGWKMLLISRGMLTPAADAVASWIAYRQQCAMSCYPAESPIKTISDGEAAGEPVAQPDITTKETETNQTNEIAQ